jgi:tRNA pseudouridine55 synthase
LRTTTDDLEGDVITRQPTDHLTAEAVRSLLPQFLGEITQVPPVYSAIQVGGKRLYDLARKGEAVTVPPRQVRIDRIEWIAWTPGDPAEATLDIYCGPGTYIRSLARDLGDTLGVGACLAGLRRTLSCGLTLENSWSWEQLEQQTPEAVLIPPQHLLTHLPIATLTAAEIEHWQRGRRLPWGDRPGSDLPWLALDEAGQCVGLGWRQDDGLGPELQPKIVLI